MAGPSSLRGWPGFGGLRQLRLGLASLPGHRADGGWEADSGLPQLSLFLRDYGGQAGGGECPAGSWDDGSDAFLAPALVPERWASGQLALEHLPCARLRAEHWGMSSHRLFTITLSVRSFNLHLTGEETEAQEASLISQSFYGLFPECKWRVRVGPARAAATRLHFYKGLQTLPAKSSDFSREAGNLHFYVKSPDYQMLATN